MEIDLRWTMAEADIKIPDIEKELGIASGSSAEKKQIKACLFTLIIYAHEQRRVKYLQDLVDTILDKFPCRIIFLQCSSKKDQNFLHVNVANVMSGQQGTMVACDQITIEASRDQLFRMPYIVIPHIVPDLPVYLLWSQPPFAENTIFSALQPYASRLIFDSECSDDLHHFCHEMEQTLGTLKIDVMDINWALVSNWRDMLVQMFDTQPKLHELQNCKKLCISYNDTKSETLRHPEIRAIYLQGWLASSLKWKYREAELYDQTLILSYASPQHPTIVALNPHTHTELPPGAIISLEITSTDNRSYYIARKQSLSQVVIHASSLEKCDVPYTLPLPDVHRGLFFMKEIFYYKLSNHYREMLQMIAQINYPKT